MDTSAALVPTNHNASLFSDSVSFDHVSRVAKVFSDSQLVPTAFQRNIPNCIIALELAHRISASPLMVMQNLHIIHGKPSFGASFMIASVNATGRFSPLRFTMVGEPNTDAWGCFAFAKSREDGVECRGVTVTMAIAKSEGWITRAGSKWKSMPELMLQYRAGTWWVRAFSPETLAGFPTEDEVYDTVPRNVTGTGEPEPQPEVEKPKKNKGVTAMKQATKPEPSVEVETKPEEPAAKQEEPPAPEPKAEEPPVEDVPPEPVVSRVRCEIVGQEEKQAKKKGGAGVVTLVGLKGEWSGNAYYDGPQAKLPAIGATIDVTLEEREHNNAKAYIIRSFQIVG